MSRIGKQIITLPQGVSLSVKSGVAEVKGPKGTLTQSFPEGISVVVENGELTVHRRDDSKEQRSFHGLVRSLLANMVEGVSTGFKKDLDVIGVGYKAEMSGDTLVLNLGYSHQIEYKAPQGITITVDKGKKKFSGYICSITVEGIDKQAVGQVAADIRSKRKPDAYKGKGVRYEDEIIRLKEGKKTA